MAAPRTVLHVDMDAFFAAIEQLDQPKLRGRPVLVGHDGPRGVVTTASYEARPFGCHSAQPMAVARRLCTDAIVVPVRMQRYREVSQRLFAILDRFAPLVEPLSIDEAFLDVTGSERLFGPPRVLACELRRCVAAELKLTASIGIAPNKFLAKLASDLDKPDGLTQITQDNVDELLPRLAVTHIWGIGPATAARLEAEGVVTIGDLRGLALPQMRRMFGAEAERFYRLARGQDSRPVTPDRRARSIGHECTFEVDVADVDHVRRILLDQVEAVSRRVRKHGLRARGVSVKIRFGEFQTISRSTTLETPTDTTSDLWRSARDLFDRWAGRSFQPVRLVGVAATRLCSDSAQLELYEGPVSRHHRVDEASDRIVERFGRGAIRRGGTLKPDPR